MVLERATAAECVGPYAPPGDSAPVLSLLRRWARGASTPRRRSLREFAEAEIVLPNGPHKGRRLRVSGSGAVQPYAGLLLDEIDSGRWQRVAVTGPTQTGKSLIGYVLPCLYHLFECGESVVLGIPDMNMANDKWREDILPVLRATKYAELLPRSGPGSRNGEIKDSVSFGNGATLKFMSGGGGDAKRSAYTARVLAGTEVDKMDEAGGGSREADKISQMEARTDAFAEQARVYLECTVSIETGRIWQEYTHGTASRIACPCPHCRQWVTPERDCLVGWKDAESEEDARELARWVCPACGTTLDDSERSEMNRRAVLAHKGQVVLSDGRVDGLVPRTRTLGFRWNAFNNLFWTAGTVAAREWRASKDPDEDNADKGMKQFVWATPYVPPKTDLSALDAVAIAQRVTKDAKRRIPSACEKVTVGVDIGKWLCHWIALAWGEHATPHVVEYGRIEVPSAEMAMERAVLLALRKFRDEIATRGWESDAGIVRPSAVLVDSGYQGDPEASELKVVYAFCDESKGFYASKGFGSNQKAGAYHAPKTSQPGCPPPGDNYHFARVGGSSKCLVRCGADYWKSWLHARLQTPIGLPGAMTLHAAGEGSTHEHLSLAKHLTAEKRVEELRPGVGTVIRWERVHRNNHWLDAAYLACVAGHWVGERLIEAMPKPAARPVQQSKGIRMPDGRPFLATQRK